MNEINGELEEEIERLKSALNVVTGQVVRLETAVRNIVGVFQEFPPHVHTHTNKIIALMEGGKRHVVTLPEGRPIGGFYVRE